MANLVKDHVFFGVFLGLIVLGGFLILPQLFGHAEIAASVGTRVALIVPLLSADLPVLGNITPAVFAAALAASQPKEGEDRKRGIALGVSALTYFLYLYISTVLQERSMFLIMGTGGAANPGETAKILETLQKFSENTRLFLLLTTGALAGLQISSKRKETTP